MPRTPDAPTTPPWETSYTCDWGDCSYPTMAWRWSGQRLAESPLGWLPVCVKHAQAADAKTPVIDGLARPDADT